MFFFLKSLSRSVHEERQEPPMLKVKAEDGGDGSSLTVWRKSLVMSCKGFTVIDSSGHLVYRVDNYNEHPEEIILMDGSGKPVLTMRRRKKLTKADSWLVYDGDVDDDYTGKSKSHKPPFCCVKKLKGILQADTGVLASVYYFNGTSSGRNVYTVEGTYANRLCKVLDETKRTVAEIKRKETTSGGISFGFDVFSLVVHPGFDSGFAMALVLMLDQMFS